MPTSLLALLGFIAWTLFLLVLMEAIRSGLVLTGTVPANDFNPGNSNLSPFMQRLARAHANCLEGLPIFGGMLGVAVQRELVQDVLACVLRLLDPRVIAGQHHFGLRQVGGCAAQLGHQF